MNTIKTFIENNGYEIITLNDGSKAAVPMKIEEVLAEYEKLVAASDQSAELREALQELSGYVRAHLAGRDADTELEWALEKATDTLDGNN